MEADPVMVVRALHPFLAHRSWRCGSDGRKRFPPAEWWTRQDCFCGLVSTLQELGLSESLAFRMAEQTVEWVA